MKLYAVIMLGGAIGSALRFLMASSIDRATGITFPWGTILVNILGSFIIGFFIGLTGPEGPLSVSANIRAFVAIGILGGFTTFSSFSLQTMQLVQQGVYWQAAGNVLISVMCCLLATGLGLFIAQHGWKAH